MHLIVKQAAKTYDFFSEGALRWIVFKVETNGFKGCLLKVGRKVLIIEEEFLKWLEGHRNG